MIFGFLRTRFISLERAKSSSGPLSYQTSLFRVKGPESIVAGPEGFEPSTIPRTRLVGSFFRLRASASLSLLLYLAEPPGQTLDDPAYGPRRPAKCAATSGFLLKIVTFTHWLYVSALRERLVFGVGVPLANLAG